jgi:hypothetical protein
MPSEIKPALTPEQWKQGVGHYDDEPFPKGVVLDTTPVRVTACPALGEVHVSIEWVDEPAAHAHLDRDDGHPMAALCLWNRRFGFQWPDVDMLLSLAGERDATADERTRLRSLADRIAALLPPREYGRFGGWLVDTPELWAGLQAERAARGLPPL